MTFSIECSYVPDIAKYGEKEVNQMGMLPLFTEPTIKEGEWGNYNVVLHQRWGLDAGWTHFFAVWPEQVTSPCSFWFLIWEMVMKLSAFQGGCENQGDKAQQKFRKGWRVLLSHCEIIAREGFVLVCLILPGVEPR